MVASRLSRYDLGTLTSLDLAVVIMNTHVPPEFNTFWYASGTLFSPAEPQFEGNRGRGIFDRTISVRDNMKVFSCRAILRLFKRQYCMTVW